MAKELLQAQQAEFRVGMDFLILLLIPGTLSTLACHKHAINVYGMKERCIPVPAGWEFLMLHTTPSLGKK